MTQHTSNCEENWIKDPGADDLLTARELSSQVNEMLATDALGNLAAINSTHHLTTCHSPSSRCADKRGLKRIKLDASVSVCKRRNVVVKA